MTEINLPAAPGEGPAGTSTPDLIESTPAQPGEGSTGLPTPSLPDSGAAEPGEGPAGLPTPTLPDDEAAQPGEGPAGLPTPSLPSRPQPERVCPQGYRRAAVQNNQSYTDLLIENNVSYNAMQSANPDLSTTSPVAGTIYCAPPSGTRMLCSSNRSYVMSQGETLYTLTRTLGISAGRLLAANPNLAPGDFLPGRVICLP